MKPIFMYAVDLQVLQTFKGQYKYFLFSSKIEVRGILMFASMGQRLSMLVWLQGSKISGDGRSSRWRPKFGK